MAVVTNLSPVREALRARRKGASNIGYEIYYEAPYATFVHENLQMKLRGRRRRGRPEGNKPRLYPNYWDPLGQGQSKFLEEPARLMGKIIGDFVFQWMAQGASMVQSMWRATLMLLEASKALVPIDTGRLKRSARARKAPWGGRGSNTGGPGAAFPQMEAGGPRF